MENPNTACPSCRIVPRAATSDRLLNSLVSGFLADNPNKDLSNAEKTDRRQDYRPGMDISPLVPFVSDALQNPGPRTPVPPDPPRAMTPEPDEEVPEIPRESPPAGYYTPHNRAPAGTGSGLEIAPQSPATRAIFSTLERHRFDQPPRTRLADYYDSPTHGLFRERAPQVAHTINNYNYYRQCHPPPFKRHEH